MFKNYSARLRAILESWHRLRVGVILAAATFIGTALSLTVPDVVVQLALPSGRDLGVQHLYAPVTHWIVQPSLWGWFANATAILLACVLVAGALSQRRQVSVVVLGTLAGGISFEVLGAGEYLAGASMVAFGLLGSVTFCGWSKWQTLALGWRAFVVISTTSIVSSLVVWTPAGKSQFAAAAVGWISALQWATNADVADETPAA